MIGADEAAGEVRNTSMRKGLERAWRRRFTSLFGSQLDLLICVYTAQVQPD